MVKSRNVENNFRTETKNYYDYSKSYLNNNYTENMYNYAKQTNENVSSNLQDVMVKKLNTQKNNYSSYTVGTQVLHPKFGVGTIINANLTSQTPDVTVYFGKFGNKTLSLSMAPLQILKSK